MKKNKLFILLFAIFTIFIFSDRVNALTYIVNNHTYTVSDVESFRDYCYYNLYKNHNKNFLIVLTGTANIGNSSYTQYSCFTEKNSNATLVHGSGTNLHWWDYDNSTQYGFNGYNYILSLDRLDNYDNISVFGNLVYSSIDIKEYSNLNSIYYSKNFNFDALESSYVRELQNYNITYYLNNEVYQIFEIVEGSSHSLINSPDYNSSNQYWSGWTYDNNIDLTNITQDINIYGSISDKPIYQIKYYINNELYHTDNVIEGDSYDEFYDFTDYNSYTHSFSGFTYDNNIDFSNVRQNIDIYGTLTEKEKLPVYIDFPITKKEFYSLEFMLGILITMLILKWFFPFKMGGDYK